MNEIRVHSSAFDDHGPIPDRLSRRGGNVSPPLDWSGVPDTAAELVLLCEDPDAGRTPFLHWLVTGIDPAAPGVPEGATPPHGHEWVNDFGGKGWGGPQPPTGAGPHRYFFRLYAVDRPVDLPSRPKAADVHAALDASALARGTLVGTFAR